MIRALLASGVLLGVGVWGVVGASGAAQNGVAKSVRFVDATGEDPKGPDITTVTVSNSDALGMRDGRILEQGTRLLTFRIAVPNRATLTEDMRVAMWIDADSDRATGLSGPNVPFVGADYMINWDLKLRPDASLLRCSGSQCQTSSAKLEYSYASGATIRALTSDVNQTERFRFLVRVTSGIVYGPGGGIDFTNAGSDVAPAEDGAWTYGLLLRPKRILVENFAAAPVAPRAGKSFTVGLKAMRDDTGTAVTSGRLVCKASVGGARLVPRSQRLARGRAACTYRLPASSAGKSVRGTITVIAHGLRATKSFARGIR